MCPVDDVNADQYFKSHNDDHKIHGLDRINQVSTRIKEYSF